LYAATTPVDIANGVTSCVSSNWVGAEPALAATATPPDTSPATPVAVSLPDPPNCLAHNSAPVGLYRATSPSTPPAETTAVPSSVAVPENVPVTDTSPDTGSTAAPTGTTSLTLTIDRAHPASPVAENFATNPLNPPPCGVRTVPPNDTSPWNWPATTAPPSANGATDLPIATPGPPLVTKRFGEPTSTGADDGDAGPVPPALDAFTENV